VRRTIAIAVLSLSAIFGGAVHIASADTHTNAQDCFGGAVSYGAQLWVEQTGHGTGYAVHKILNWDFSIGEWNQYYRTEICGG
jgi:hypothetical protein